RAGSREQGIEERRRAYRAARWVSLPPEKSPPALGQDLLDCPLSISERDVDRRQDAQNVRTRTPLRGLIERIGEASSPKPFVDSHSVIAMMHGPLPNVSLCCGRSNKMRECGRGGPA